MNLCLKKGLLAKVHLPLTGNSIVAHGGKESTPGPPPHKMEYKQPHQ